MSKIDLDYVGVIRGTVADTMFEEKTSRYLRRHGMVYMKHNATKLVLSDKYPFESLMLIGEVPVGKGDEIVAYVDLQALKRSGIFKFDRYVREFSKDEFPFRLDKVVDGEMECIYEISKIGAVPETVQA